MLERVTGDSSHNQHREDSLAVISEAKDSCSVAELFSQFWRLVETWDLGRDSPINNNEHFASDLLITESLALEFNRLAAAITNTHVKTFDELLQKMDVVAEFVRIHGAEALPKALLISLFDDFDKIIAEPLNVVSFLIRRFDRATMDDLDGAFDAGAVCRAFWRLWSDFSCLSNLQNDFESAVASSDQKVRELWCDLETMTGLLAKTPARTSDDLAAKRVALGICLHFEGNAKHTGDLIESFFHDLKTLGDSDVLALGLSSSGT